MTSNYLEELSFSLDKLSPSATITDETAPVDEDSCLLITTMTWTRDSHELFDYEARHVHKKSYYLRKPARIFRTVLDVKVIPEGDALPTQTADYLLAVRQHEGRYIVVPADRNLHSTTNTAIFPKKIWLIVKDLPSKCHNLREGDVMKLGRFKLRVKQLAKEGTVSPELRLDDLDIPHSVLDSQEALMMQCRICLLDGGSTTDPLICPCQCKGSIKYVHLDCLRHWINGRLSVMEDEQRQKMSFFFKQLHCELCKTAFPSSLMIQNERVPIVKIPRIEAPFIILENVVGNTNRGLHVISMEVKKELKLGRGHESDVRIADVSISRYHATIRLSNGEFVLEDHNSKFGTLVSPRKILPIQPSHTLAIQVGRTILNLSLNKPPRPFDTILALKEDGTVSEQNLDQTNGDMACPNKQIAADSNNMTSHNPDDGFFPPVSASFNQSVGAHQSQLALPVVSELCPPSAAIPLLGISSSSWLAAPVHQPIESPSRSSVHSSANRGAARSLNDSPKAAAESQPCPDQCMSGPSAESSAVREHPEQDAHAEDTLSNFPPQPHAPS